MGTPAWNSSRRWVAKQVSAFCCPVYLRFLFSTALGFLTALEHLAVFNHRIIKGGKDLQDHQVQPSAQHHLAYQTLKGHIRLMFTFFEPLEGWGLHHVPGQPGPRPDHSFSEEIYPNIQSKPPLTQPEAISSRPVIV